MKPANYQQLELQQQQTFDASRELSGVFDTLMQARDLASDDAQRRNDCVSKLGKNLGQSLFQHQRTIRTLQRHPKYSRHIIGKKDEWTGLICRWEAGSCSSIHGHPAFTFYHVFGGSFAMDLYDRDVSGQLVISKTHDLEPGDTYWENGDAGRYDNLIHRVRARHHGYTLMLFSEDPGRGEVYSG